MTFEELDANFEIAGVLRQEEAEKRYGANRGDDREEEEYTGMQ